MNLARFLLAFFSACASFHPQFLEAQQANHFELNPPSGVNALESLKTAPGHLMMVGGALQTTNKAVFDKLIEYAGGVDNARFVILPAANLSTESGRGFCEELRLHGIPPDRAEVLNVFESNAATATNDKAILDMVRNATAVYMIGGDQRRLVRALTRKDGSDTPLLYEMRKLYQRGGLIAGTSAGASAQSQLMLAVSGLPDMLVDEGLDTLDYGLTDDVAERGLLMTRGLGFHHPGIIDQHFLQYRGRLGRLTRATADSGVPCGFGIDKNSAMSVEPDGRVLIAGGNVLIIEPGESLGQDGPCGYEIRDVRISLLSDGDVYDPRTKKVSVAASKAPLLPKDLAFNGNFLIGDIGAGYAITGALISGLAENHRQVQEGIVLKFHGVTSHGYRCVFRKHADTRAFLGNTLDGSLYSLVDVRLDIMPIANGLREASTQVPFDLPEGPEKTALAAVAFRGLMTTNDKNEFRPSSPITRSEFASALARSVHLSPPLQAPPEFADVDIQTVEGDEILRVVAAGFMSLDQVGNFYPSQALSPVEAATGLTKLCKLSRSKPDADLEQTITSVADWELKDLSRGAMGLMLHRILKLPK